MLNPLTKASPDVGVIKVQSILTVVVFPAPFGPNSPRISPPETLKLMPPTATTDLGTFRNSGPSLVSKVFESSLTSTGFMADQFFGGHATRCVPN